LEELEMMSLPESGDELDELVESVADPASACALRLLLGEWREPLAPESLQFRVVNSFRLQLGREEDEVMNRCPKCRREFAPQYKFCPVDGLPLAPGFYIAPPEIFAADDPFAAEISLQDEPAFVGSNGGSSKEKARKIAAAVSIGDRERARATFHLTFLEEAGLFSRLSAEVREVARESQLSWPELKRDPRGFLRRGLNAYAHALHRFFAQPNVAYGVLTGFVVVLSIVGAALMLERLRGHSGSAAHHVNDELELIDWVTLIPEAEKKLEDGAAGVNRRGTGGGSNPKREKPGGGGGGGARELKPASRGKLPTPTLLPQINAPSPKPPTIKNPSLPVPATIRVDPLLVQNDPRLLPYGDPKSQSTELSAGPGDGGGIGDGTGGGIGPGNGTGYGPGREFNTGGGPAKVGGPDPGGAGASSHRPLKIQEVTRKAQIVSRPEPQYTEEARKNSVTGEVMLRAVLSADGRVTNIQPMKRLPDGLTEKAIAAARLIKFTPAEKDGRAVSQYVTLVYNFNIY